MFNSNITELLLRSAFIFLYLCFPAKLSTMSFSQISKLILILKNKNLIYNFQLDLTDQMKLVQSLSNATNSVLQLKGVNVAIARKAVKQLIREELTGNNPPNSHLKSVYYFKNF